MSSPPPALAGRDTELAAQRQALADVRAGTPRALALVGDAGIGKSALLRALRADAGELLLLTAGASEHEADVPFGPVVDALDAHVATLHPRRLASLGEDRVAELAAVLPGVARHTGAPADGVGPAERFRLHRAVGALLDLLARERPVVLVLDDVHWADDATVELLTHLLRRPPAAPHLLALAMRPAGPAERLLDALRGSPAATVLTLEPLDDEAAGHVVAGVEDAALRARLVAEARGNPLYLEELARTAGKTGTTLPGTLMAAVAREVFGLSGDARAMLEGAAVAGDPFDPELAAAAAGLPEAAALSAIDALAAEGLVHPGAGPREFAFRHPLFRRAVYDATPPGWRLAAHARAADALSRRGAPLAVRAAHVERCAAPGDAGAARLLADAAATTLDASPGTAARWYAAALALLPHHDRAGRVDLLTARVDALILAGRLEEARGDAEAAVALLDGRPAAEQLPALLRAADVEMWLLRPGGRARDRLRAILDAGAPAGDRAQVLYACTMLATLGGELDEALVLAYETVAAADPDDPLEVCAGHAALAHLLHLRREHAAMPEPLARGTAAAEAVPDGRLAEHLDVLLLVAMSHVMLDRVREAAPLFDRGLRIARLGTTARLSTVAAYAAHVRLALLDVDGGLAAAEIAEETTRLQGNGVSLFYALTRQVLGHWAAGDAATARRAAADAAAELERLPSTTITRTLAANLAIVDLDDDPARCLATLAEVAGAELELVEASWSTALALVGVRAALALGDTARAESLTAESERRAAALALPAAGVRAATARAHVLLARGEAEAACAIALDAVDAAARADLPLDGLAARVVAGAALGQADRRDEATAMLRKAAADAERGGALRLRDEAARELRRLGTRLRPAARRPGTPADGLDALSDREREIAALVAAGRMNKQIAAALFVSEKTVEGHLSRIYGKLGIRSRVELAALSAAAAPSSGPPRPPTPPAR